MTGRDVSGSDSNIPDRRTETEHDGSIGEALDFR
jgi:hypothetical protein